jgi:hypothetical protein
MPDARLGDARLLRTFYLLPVKTQKHFKSHTYMKKIIGFKKEAAFQRPLSISQV